MTTPPTNAGAGSAAVPSIDDVVLASDRLRGTIPVTPLSFSPGLSALTGRTIFVKWENKLPTGSFKERGVVNFLLQGADQYRAQGVWAGSAGNHALALSYHAHSLGIPCHIVMPKTAPLVKLQAVRHYGAHVHLHGEVFDEAYHHARAMAEETGGVFVPGFDHHAIIAGQGTAGLEILDQLPDVDAIAVPVGGGGLMAGVALAVRSRHPSVRLLGVQSRWVHDARIPPSAVIPRPLLPRSIADGIAVKQIGSLTAQVMHGRVDSLVAVPEEALADAVMRFLEIERAVIEGAGAAALAGVCAGHLPPEARKVVVVASGSNIDLNVLSRLIERDMAQRSRLLRLSISVPDRPGALHALTGLIAEHQANVLQVYHDRASCRIPGNVTISFLVEVRDEHHKSELMAAIRSRELQVDEI